MTIVTDPRGEVDGAALLRWYDDNTERLVLEVPAAYHHLLAPQGDMPEGYEGPAADEFDLDMGY